MKAIVKNGAIVFGPAIWNAEVFNRSAWESVVDHPISFASIEPAGSQDVVGITLADVVETAPPSYDAATQYATASYALNGSVVTQGWTVSVLPPPRVPDMITARQAKLALFSEGIYDVVANAVANAGTRAMIEWDSTNFERNSDLVMSIGHGVGLTDAEIDTIFVAGSKL